MRKEVYESTWNDEENIFLFFSIGKKGVIPKVISYQELEKDIFNLAFGDLNIQTGEVSDTISSNNGDTMKVITTIVQTIPLFFNKYPHSTLLFKGSNDVRTKLYQRIIINYQDEISGLFEILGKIEGDPTLSKVEKNKNYTEFRIIKL